MSLPRGLIFIISVCLLVLTSAVVADTNVETEKEKLEVLIGRLRESLEDEVSSIELSLPEDTSQRFLVKEVHFSGNNLVSTAQLLEKMPLTYTPSEEKDVNAVEEIYDFRNLLDIVVNPGREREVSLKSIQGLTKYVLSIYQEKGYAGIYVYVPAKAVDGEAKLVDSILPIEVLEGKVAKVAIERYDFDRQEQEEGVLKDSVIHSWSPVQVGEVIKKKELGDFVNLEPKTVPPCFTSSASFSRVSGRTDAFLGRARMRYFIPSGSTKAPSLTESLSCITSALI